MMKLKHLNFEWFGSVFLLLCHCPLGPFATVYIGFHDVFGIIEINSDPL